VLTRTDDSEEPLDLTDSIVTGTAATFSGGVTSTLPPAKRVEGPGGNGTNGTRADRGAGNPGPASGPDQSHPPRVLGAMAWDCPFPSAADVDGINNALATIRVEVDASGKVSRVHVLRDPGHGFGDAARHCAALKRWEPAAGRDGRAVAGGINVSVRFTR
jgi:protein TonB